jgi:alginate O-acetyltransferase complex protein AlgI
MLFNSVPFLSLFLPLVLSSFFLLGWLRWQTLAVLWLALASLVFYGWDDPSRLLPIILSSIAFNFIVGWILVRQPTRAVLAIGICGNLMLLGYFKYAGFLAETFTALTGIAMQRPSIVLPIGISFFTFTQIAFLVDAFRGEARTYKPWHYLLGIGHREFDDGTRACLWRMDRLGLAGLSHRRDGEPPAHGGGPDLCSPLCAVHAHRHRGRG